MALTADMTIREILRARPSALEPLEAAGGSLCWRRLDERLGDFCGPGGLADASLLARVLAVSAVPPGEDWRKAPLCRLVDHLTGNHDIYRDKVLPGLQALATPVGCVSEAEGDFLAETGREIHAFAVDFRLHVEEEESYLFPKALRTEACLRFPDLSPEIFKGSVDAFPAAMLKVPEERVEELLAHIRRRVTDAGGNPALRAPATRLDGALKALDADLRAHAALETETLLPRVRALEEALGRRVRQEQAAGA